MNEPVENRKKGHAPRGGTLSVPHHPAHSQVVENPASSRRDKKRPACLPRRKDKQAGQQNQTGCGDGHRVSGMSKTNFWPDFGMVVVSPEVTGSSYLAGTGT